jgi:hypothetical protein
VRSTVFWPCDKELAIRGHSTSDHEILALSAKEPLSDSWALHWFIFKQPDAVVSGVNKKLVFVFWVHN